MYIKQKMPAGTYSWLNQNVDIYSVITLFVVKITLGEVQDVIEKLYEDIEDGMRELQLEGHPKW